MICIFDQIYSALVMKYLTDCTCKPLL